MRNAAQPLAGASHDYDALLELIGVARIALLGEPRTGRMSFTVSEAILNS